MVNEANIEPHVPVWERGEGKDGRLFCSHISVVMSRL
jgi:hypothetical protein